jgi:predicted transcriptional regulator of viral defense system
MQASQSERIHLTPREQELYFALLNKGQWVLSTQDAMRVVGIREGHAWKVLHSLHRKGALARAAKGLYVITPPDALHARHRNVGDPFRLIDQLLRALNLPYYVGYMSAAFLHGAAHQLPFHLEVATPHPRRPVRLGSARVVFHKLPPAHMFGTVRVRQSGQYLTVSDAEKTLLDCADRLDLCGGIEGLAQIAWELARRGNAQKLHDHAGAFGSPAVAQRLGYVLARIQALDSTRVPAGLAEALKDFVGAARYPLDPSLEHVGETDSKWKVQVNVDVLGWLRA